MKTNLTPQQRKEAFFKLGTWLRNRDEELAEVILRSPNYNAWFTPQFTSKALDGIARLLCDPDMEDWILTGTSDSKSCRIGLILAGNIPLVGFHDILSVLASGHIALIKLSSQDKILIPKLLSKLVGFEPGFARQIQYVDMLKDFDAVIATGSNNSSRYFEHYFSRVPHVIRKNRNSAAVLTGSESSDQLKALGNDIFDYYGLGCRNVSKIFVPLNYDFTLFFEAIEEFKGIADHHKYNNNYDYNKSIFLVNMEKHLDNGFLLLKESESFSSPLAVLYYEYYTDLETLLQTLSAKADQIQCLVSETGFIPDAVSFGESQLPGLYDYADGVNTMEFLKKLT